jgi:hypothetical protein
LYCILHVVIHESGHIFVAIFFGLDIYRIEITPIWIYIYMDEIYYYEYISTLGGIIFTTIFAVAIRRIKKGLSNFMLLYDWVFYFYFCMIMQDGDWYYLFMH